MGPVQLRVFVLMVHPFSLFDKVYPTIVPFRLYGAVILWCCLATVEIATAQTNPLLVNPDAVPAQIVPTYKEVGITWGGVGGGNSPPNTSGTDPGGNPSGGSTALNALRATNYGATAERVAEQQGISLESIAAVGEAESGFRNIATANGSSSATGPWQFTSGTFQTISDKYGLGYTAADINNPQAQATEVSYLMREDANAISAVTQQPATTLQTYGAWVFGASSGAQIAAVTADTRLSQIVSAQALANNGMSSWTVGQFRQVMTNRLGSAANQTVLTSS